VRYCTRPPFALDRIEVLGDGRIAYQVKTVRRGRTHRVMTPMEFMARLAALVPPARILYVRYHGVFASRSEIPRNPSGKVLKRELRAPYWRGRGREIN
jgi:acyl-CoA synthetase (AMP-forming)/AMP-acid ligase II